ncbi:hypothetical protein REG_0858 [Candidatus Regiella insecticola LSR1]|uniref:Uncharacterized protein n=1 Tax=Candidatus Regiella insecticola LSR1 TaxID=663321 RepID=E0WSC0_9ENTR|nr:hypothetical protein REG_0858 [Candidatus Regiella insecticola LSR1]
MYQIHDAQPCMIVDGSVAKSTEAEAKKPQEESLEKIENSTLTFTYQPKLIKMQSRDR